MQWIRNIHCTQVYTNTRVGTHTQGHTDTHAQNEDEYMQMHTHAIANLVVPTAPETVLLPVINIRTYVPHLVHKLVPVAQMRSQAEPPSSPPSSQCTGQWEGNGGQTDHYVHSLYIIVHVIMANGVSESSQWQHSMQAIESILGQSHN